MSDQKIPAPPEEAIEEQPAEDEPSVAKPPKKRHKTPSKGKKCSAIFHIALSLGVIDFFGCAAIGGFLVYAGIAFKFGDKKPPAKIVCWVAASATFACGLSNIFAILSGILKENKLTLLGVWCGIGNILAGVALIVSITSSVWGEIGVAAAVCYPAARGVLITLIVLIAVYTNDPTPKKLKRTSSTPGVVIAIVQPSPEAQTGYYVKISGGKWAQL